MKNIMIQYALALLLLACSAIHASEDAPGLVVAEQRLELGPCEFIHPEGDGEDIAVDLECLARQPLPPVRTTPPPALVLGPCEYLYEDSEDGGDVMVDFECLEGIEQ